VAENRTVPEGLFTTALDEFATAWLKTSGRPKSIEPALRTLLALELVLVSEGLLLSPKVSFKVYGENVVICRLIDAFGEKGVQQLLEEHAIEFVLWRPMILYADEPMEGMIPILAGNHSSPAHCDPEASAMMGLRGWSKEPVRDIDQIVRLASERTRMPAEDLPHAAVGVLRAAVEAGTLASDGFDAATPWHKIPRDKLRKLTQLAETYVETAIVLKAGHEFRDSKESWDALVKLTASFRSSDALHQATEQVLRLEGLPNIPNLILKGGLRFDEIVKVRTSKATTEFREWLWSNPSPTDAKAVAEKYLAHLKPGTNVADKTWFKAARIATLNAATTVAGMALGGVVAGTPGVIAGGVLGLATSLADEFGLSRLLRGKNPRRFAEEEIRPRAAQMIADLDTQSAAASSAPSARRTTQSRPPAPAPPIHGSPTPEPAPPSPRNRHERRGRAAEEKRKNRRARRQESAQKAKQRRKRK
jgi:hypothetical protein